MNKKSFLAMSLTDETLYDVNMAMPNWIQLGHREFLMSMVHDLREQALKIEYFLGVVIQDKNLVHQSLESLANKRITTKEVYDSLLEVNGRTKKILDIAQEYAEEMENT